MQLMRSLCLLPIISLIGISLAFHICGSILFDIIVIPFKRNKSGQNSSKMWKCKKCAKPVYFAERKSSLGFDWHPQCLTCEECGKRLNPGQHAEHKGIPYCYIPCYGALFGPTLYGHGSRVESHASFGKSKTNYEQMDKSLEVKLKEYNQYYEGKSNVIHYRERNGKLILEGSLRIYWDVSNVIQLKEDNDERVFVKKRKSKRDRRSIIKTEVLSIKSQDSSSPLSDSTSSSSPEEIVDADQADRKYKTLPNSSSKKNADDFKKTTSKSFDDEYIQQISDAKMKESDPELAGVTLRRGANLRRSRAKLTRRCSINGHFYNRETSVFTPAHGSVTSVWITSLVNPHEVINLLLDKFKVTNGPENFALFVIRDNGECKRILDNEFPLIIRVLLGPNEDAAKIFILNKNKNEITNEVAQYLHFSNIELQTFLRKFEEEEIREVYRIKKSYAEIKNWIKLRIKELSVVSHV